MCGGDMVQMGSGSGSGSGADGWRIGMLIVMFAVERGECVERTQTGTVISSRLCADAEMVTRWYLPKLPLSFSFRLHGTECAP
jgi:hypothetical protein